MSRRLPALVLAAACATGALLVPAGTAAAAPATAAGPTAVDPFYDVPSPLRKGAPGAVLRTRPAAVPLAGALPFTASTVLYHSRTVTGADEIVSGTLFTPTLSSPAAAGTLLTLAPGTQGLGPQCAPSKQFVAGTEYESAAVVAALAQGWSVAVTDYDGYVNGGAPTYVTGEAMGHAVLDMARAAARVPGARVTPSSPVLLQGYSQGGGGAGWAASLAADYTPELNIRAAAVGGVPADVHAVADSLDGTATAYFEMLGIVGMANAHPAAFRLDERLNERGRQLVAGLRSECVGGPTTLRAAGTSISDYTVDGATLDDLAQEPAIARVLADNQLAARPAPTVPVYQDHAAGDEIVQPAQATALHAAWCAAGVTTRYDLLPAEHVTGGVESIAPFTAWLSAAAAGRPVAGNC